MHEHPIGELIQMVKDRQLDVLLAVIDKRERGFCYQTIFQCDLVMAAVKNHPVVPEGGGQARLSLPLDRHVLLLQ